MTRFSCFITGEDYDLLKKETPKSKQKVAALTTALFVPVAFWFISTLLLAYHVLGEPLWIALTAGLVTSFFIFLIERIIIMSNGSVAMIIFRVIVGFVIAALGSLSIDEVLFKEDVNQQLMTLEQEKIENELVAIDQRYTGQLTRQQALVDQNYAAWTEAQKTVEEEADGTKGSGQKGIGDITKLKQDHASSKLQEYKTAKDEMSALQSKIETEKKDAREDIETSFSHHALLHRIKALFDLVLTDGFMMAAYIFFTVLFLAMEFLVVFLKVVMPTTNYERRKEAMEIIGERRINTLVSHDGKVFKPEQKAQVVKRVNGELNRMGVNSTLL